MTRWWVVDRSLPAPSGNDKTTLRLAYADVIFGAAIAALGPLCAQLLTIYERPNKQSLDTHHDVIEPAGHATEEPLKTFLTQHRQVHGMG